MVDRTFKNLGKTGALHLMGSWEIGFTSGKGIGFLCFRRHFFLFQVRTQANTAQFRGKSKLEMVLKMKRYGQRLSPRVYMGD